MPNAKITYFLFEPHSIFFELVLIYTAMVILEMTGQTADIPG